MLLAAALALAGCASVPPAHVVQRTSPGELQAHVEFLCRPSLEGRGPRTEGSRIARQYIESRFAAYGLVPWAGLKSYEIGFGLGTNVVGVLPGADANLAGEIVLVSAHYDHLGRKQGHVYSGAADNASGVAVLLETAKQMSLFEERPKRSIAFAAFDCEEKMLVGSMAFTCRPDVREANLVGVVNVDLLGRDFLDVVENSVFLAGAEEYPTVRERIRQFGTDAGIRVLPISTDLIGPDGDHAAFESRGVPCLFFTSGTYRDYHQPTDTPDKLNYADIEDAAQVILATVAELAEGEEPQRVPVPDTGDLEELRTVATVLSEVSAKPAEVGIDEKDVETLVKLQSRIQALLVAGRYDRRTREDLIVDAGRILIPYLLPRDDTRVQVDPPQKSRGIQVLPGARTPLVQQMQYLYMNYRGQIMDGYRRLLGRIMEHPPGLLRGIPKCRFELYDIPDDLLSVREIGPDQYALNALANSLTITIGPTLSVLQPMSPDIRMGLDRMDCRGSREQIADYCLVQMRDRKDRPDCAPALRKILARVTATEPNGTYEELLNGRLQRGGFGNEAEWLLSCVRSECPDLMVAALRSAGAGNDLRVRDAAGRIAVDPNRCVDVRQDALRVAVQTRDTDGLLTACTLLGDPTPLFDPEIALQKIDRDDCFAERAIVKIVRTSIENQLPPGAKLPLKTGPRTLGDAALIQLKQATRRDFGADAAAWRNWIQAHEN